MISKIFLLKLSSALLFSLQASIIYIATSSATSLIGLVMGLNTLSIPS